MTPCPDGWTREQRPHLVAPRQVEGPAATGANHQQLAARDPAQVQVCVGHGTPPHQRAIAQVETVDGLRIHGGGNNLAVHYQRWATPPNDGPGGGRLIGLRNQRLNAHRRRRPGRAVAMGPGQGAGGRLDAEDGAGVGGADQDAVVVRQMGRVQPAVGVLGQAPRRAGQDFGGQDLALRAQHQQAQVSILLVEHVKPAVHRQRCREKVRFGQVGGSIVAGCPQLPAELAGAQVECLQSVAGQGAPDRSGQARVFLPRQVPRVHDWVGHRRREGQIIDRVNRVAVGGGLADERVLEDDARPLRLAIGAEPASHGRRHGRPAESGFQAKRPAPPGGFARVQMDRVDAGAGHVKGEGHRFALVHQGRDHGAGGRQHGLPALLHGDLGLAQLLADLGMSGQLLLPQRVEHGNAAGLRRALRIAPQERPVAGRLPVDWRSCQQAQRDNDNVGQVLNLP